MWRYHSQRLGIRLMGIVCVFLAACSTTHTQTVNSANQTPTSPIQPKLSQPQIEPLIQEQIEPIFVPFRKQFKRPDGTLSPYLQQWAEHLSHERQIPLNTITELLLEVDYEPTVIRLMTPAKTQQRKRSWPAYKKRTVDEARVQAGLKFWRQHAEQIQHTAQTYQVPASILVAIIGVETIYGQYMGDFKVLEALANLGFSYPDPNRPERAAMFREQLADFIELHYQDKVNARYALGSYAGAMGLPQFMPTSIKKWAVDAEQKGHVDLYQSVPDALSSIANFLNHHGWQANLPVFIETSLSPTTAAPLVDGGLEPTLSPQELLQKGIHLPLESSPEVILGVIDLVDEPSGQTEYRLATPNFFALTAYNRSYFYASSVADFACALERRYYERPACNLWQPPKS